MRPTNKTDLAKVEQALNGLDVRDKIVVLITSIINHDHSALGAAFGMTNVVERMAEEMSQTQRYHVAEALRNAADRVECREEKCPVTN